MFTKKTGIIITVTLLCVVWLGSVGFADNGNAYGLVKKQIDAYLNRLTASKQFSGMAFVAKDGKIILKKGYGKANYETGQLNTADTVYPIASMGKAFTAMSIMMLQERGLLSIDDPVSLYVPEYPAGDSMTIRNLLNMTAGIPNFLLNAELWENISVYHTPMQLLETFINLPLSFTPGTNYEYCNSCFVTLGIIIERVSGQSYRDFLKRNIFRPLCMTSTSYDPTYTEFVDRMAVGYATLNPLAVSILLHPSNGFSAGGIFTTINDYYKWDQSLYTDRLVSFDTLEEMFTPGLGDYAMGWWSDYLVVNGEAHRDVWHTGSYLGFHSIISRLIDDRVTVILILNSTVPNESLTDMQDVKNFRNEIVKIIFDPKNRH